MIYTSLKILILTVLSFSISLVFILTDDKDTTLKEDGYKLLQLILLSMFLITLLPIWR